MTSNIETLRNIVTTLDASRDDATKAFAVLSELIRNQIARGGSDKTIEAAEKRKRRPSTKLKLKLDGRVGAEFSAELWSRRLSAELWSFETIKVSIVLDNNKRPIFGARLSEHGLTWRVYRHGTGERMAKLVAAIIALVAEGKAHFLSIGENEHCRVCGRHLRDERSVADGIGPECILTLFGAADQAEAEQRQIDDLLARIKEIRATMKAEHPDLGGTGDGALFARLSGELKSLRAELAKMEGAS